MTRTPDDRLDPSLRRLIGVILLGGMLGILNSTMVAAGIDLLTRDLHASLSTVGWVSTGFLLAVTVTIPVTGWAVTRFGGRRMWLFGLGLFLLGSLASALAWNVQSLIVFRVVQGVAAGVLDPLVLTLLARAAGPRRAGRVMGLMAAVLSLGPVLGPVVGGTVSQGLGWRSMFLVSLPIGILALVLAYRVMPADAPRPDRTDGRFDVLGVALLGPGFAGVLLALSQSADRAGGPLWPTLVPLVGGVLLLIGYAGHAVRRRSAALIDVRLFARGGFTASVVLMGLTGLAMFASLFAVPLYFQQVRGHGALAAGLLVAPLGVGAAVAAPLAGHISDRIGSRNLALAGACVAALSALALAGIGAGSSEMWVVAGAVAVGVGLGFVGPPAMGSLYRTLPGPMVPQGSSVLYMLNQLGASVGIAVVAFLVQTSADPLTGFHSVYWLVVAATVAILAAGALLPGRATPPETAAIPAAATQEGCR